MSTIKVDTVRPVTADASLTLQGDNSGTGVSGITIDSSGNATFAGTGNNLGTVTAGTIGGDVAMASGLTVRNITQVAKSSDTEVANSTADTTVFSPTYTPLFSGSKVQGILTIIIYALYSTSNNARKKLQQQFTGSDITDITMLNNELYGFGAFDYSATGIQLRQQYSIMGPLLTTTGTSVITNNIIVANATAHADSSFTVIGNGTSEETFFTWVEYK